MIEKMYGNSKAKRVMNEIIDKSEEIVVDQLEQPWSKVKNKDITEVRPISMSGKGWIRLNYINRYNEPVTDGTIETAVSNLIALARANCKKQDLFLRVAEHKGDIYYDLCNKKWQQVRITHGKWKIIEQSDSPVMFKRYIQMNEQKIVEKASVEDAKELLNFINIDEDSSKAMFLLVYIATVLIPNIPHAVLHLKGVKGTAKSNLSRIIKRIVDPAMPELITLNKDLEQNLAHNWFALFDNISQISKQESDILCRASTGAGIAKRKLFKDDQDVFYNIKHCVALNGIDYKIPKSDLMDRSIIIELDPISSRDRLSENKLHNLFEEKRPSIVSGFFEVIAEAMSIKENLEFEHLPRMADFFEWGTAIAVALGYDKEYFESCYFDMIHNRLESFHSPNGFIKALKLYVEENGSIKASASDIITTISSYAEKNDILIEKSYSPSWVTRKIKSKMEYFNDMNISIESGRYSSGVRFIHLFK